MKKTVFPITFMITESKMGFVIQWKIADVQTVAEFLYWADRFNARYELHLRPKGYDIGLHALSGGCGEHPDGIRWSYDLGLHRVEGGSTHHLTQHGLDGLPKRFVIQELLTHPHREDQLFTFRPSAGGGFTLSYREWDDYFCSGRESRGLLGLSIAGNLPEGVQ